MAIKGLQRENDGSREILSVEYILERERDNLINPMTIFIRPKDTAAANRTLKAYGETSRDRKGSKQFNVSKLNNADLDEWITVVSRIDNYEFSNQFPDLEKHGVMKNITDVDVLKKVLVDLTNDIVNEVFDAASDTSLLDAGTKKGLPSLSTTTNGNQKNLTEAGTSTVTTVDDEGLTEDEPAS